MKTLPRTIPLLTSLMALLLTAPFAQAASVRIAQNNGSATFTASDYSAGFGTPGDPSFILSGLGSYDSLGDTVIVKLTMGNVTDYFKPAPGNTLLSMLTSGTNHLWSASVSGTFVKPLYNSGGNLGGSQSAWPLFFAPSDPREFLSFWGGSSAGGCCTQQFDNATSFGQAFQMDAVLSETVPLPGALPLALFGLGGLGALRSLRRVRSQDT